MVLLKSKAFLTAVSLVLAALIAQFAPEYGVTAAKLEAVFLAVLALFNVYPELKAMGLYHRLPNFLKLDAQEEAKEVQKKSYKK